MTRSEIFYNNPNVNKVKSERYSIFQHDDKVYVVIMGDRSCPLWNLDRTRNSIFNQISNRELALVNKSDITLVVSIGEHEKNRTLVFKTEIHSENKEQIMHTDFEKREQASLPFVDILNEIAPY